MSLLDLFMEASATNSVSTWRLVQHNIVQLSLFSRNEDLEDLSSTDMKFLTVQAYLALALVESGGQDGREATLLDARAHFDSYLDLIDCYSLLSKEDKAWLKDTREGIKPASNMTRNLKIAQFKRERESKAKLAELQEILSLSDADSDVEREVVLTSIEILVQQSINGLTSVRAELEMIEYAKTLAPKAKIDEIDLEQINLRTEYSGPLLSAKGKPLRPFVISSEHNKRQDVQDGVFRSGHNLPTMTIDEYLDREIERGNFLQGGTQLKEVKDDTIEVSDEATMKARNFDEFKGTVSLIQDFNPAGWGNRHNKG